MNFMDSISNLAGGLSEGLNGFLSSPLANALGNGFFSPEKVNDLTPDKQEFLDGNLNELNDFGKKLGDTSLSAFTAVISVGTAIAFPEVELIGAAIIAVCSCISSVASLICGGEQMDPGELAARAFSAEKGPDDFENTAAYLEYLKNLDSNVIDTTIDTQSPEMQEIGGALQNKMIEETTGTEIDPTTYITAQKADMTHEELASTITKAAEEGLESFKNLDDFLNRSMDPEDAEKMDAIVSDGLHDANPEMSDSEVENRMDDLRIPFTNTDLEEA